MITNTLPRIILPISSGSQCPRSVRHFQNSATAASIAKLSAASMVIM